MKKFFAVLVLIGSILIVGGHVSAEDTVAVTETKQTFDNPANQHEAEGFEYDTFELKNAQDTNAVSKGTVTIFGYTDHNATIDSIKMLVRISGEQTTGAFIGTVSFGVSGGTKKTYNLSKFSSAGFTFSQEETQFFLVKFTGLAQDTNYEFQLKEKSTNSQSDILVIKTLKIPEITATPTGQGFSETGGKYTENFKITADPNLTEDTPAILNIYDASDPNEPFLVKPVTVSAGANSTNQLVVGFDPGEYFASVSVGDVDGPEKTFKIVEQEQEAPAGSVAISKEGGQVSLGGNKYKIHVSVTPNQTLTEDLEVDIYFAETLPTNGTVPTSAEKETITLPAGSTGVTFDTPALSPESYMFEAFADGELISFPENTIIQIAGAADLEDPEWDEPVATKISDTSHKVSALLHIFDDSTVAVRLQWATSPSGLSFSQEKEISPASSYQAGTDKTFEGTLDGLTKGTSYYYQFYDDESGVTSGIASFVAGTDGDGSDSEKKGSGWGDTLKSPFGEKYNTIPKIIVALVDNLVIPIAVPFVILAIIYTGWLFVTARGNTTKLETAKKSALYTAIGAAVILGAWVIAGAISGTINEIKGAVTETETTTTPPATG